jgi:hypothetical protein
VISTRDHTHALNAALPIYGNVSLEARAICVASVAFTLVALAYYPALAWLLVPFSASVAASRVVLGLHYPSDVLAATAIGCTLAGMSLWLVPGATLLG